MKKVFCINSSEGSSHSLGDLIKRLRAFGYSFENIDTVEQVNSLNTTDIKIALVGVDASSEEQENTEVCKAFKERFPQVDLVAVFGGKLEYDQQVLFNADIDVVYQYPVDDELIINHFFEKDPVDLSNNQLSFDIMARVNVTELKAGDSLPFALYVYLPANEKIIPYNHKDQALDEVVLEKFRKNSHYSLYVKKIELGSYYDYCAKSLKDMEEEVGSLEHTQKVTRHMKSLMSGFFDGSTGNAKESGQILDNMGKIVSQLEDQSGSKVDLVNEVNKIAARQMTNYSHAKNMSTYCAMFGMMAGINEPQSLRIGGLLHDLGMMDLPLSLLHKEEKDMDEMETAQFKLHPGNAKLSLVEKGLKVPKSVENMIMQHHEKSDGSGFPYGIKADEIDPMAKVCAFADAFDTLTSVRKGYRQLSPENAMKRIAGMDGEAPEGIYDPNFHQKIIVAFFDGELEVPSVESISAAVTAVSEVEGMAEEDNSGAIEIIEEIANAGKKKEPEDSRKVGAVKVASGKESYGAVQSSDKKKVKDEKIVDEDKMGYVLSQMMDDDESDESESKDDGAA